MDLPLLLPSEGPLVGRIAAALRAAILSGALTAGTRLPPTRLLSGQLGVARGSVVAAYEELISEGYCRARVGAGTYVDVSAPDAAAPLPDTPPQLSAWATRIGGELESAWPGPAPRYDFRGGPSADALPLVSLGAALRRAAGRLGAEMSSGPSQGLLGLREALIAHLGRGRGVRADAGRVVIVNGTQQGIDLAARLLLDPGDTVCIEEPCYPRARAVFAALGARLVPVPVDRDGLITDRLPSEGARLLYLTPSHQYPTGAVLSAERRLAALAWAERHDAWVLEDDYDSEFRYTGPPLPALQGLDRSGRCLYLGSLSKLLHPALRAGCLVLPPALVAPAVAAKRAVDQATTPIIGEALAELFITGEIERHLRRATRLYRTRRAHMLGALAAHPLPGATVWPATGGLHLFVEAADVDPEALARQARARGVGYVAAGECYLHPPPGAGLILWFSRMPVECIRPGIAALGAALAGARRRE